MDRLIKEGVKVDAIITDPPYGKLNKNKTDWDNIIPYKEMWDRLQELSNDNTPIVLFGVEPFSSELRISNIKNYKYDWIWEKSNPSNIGNANRQPMRYHENISVFYKKQCKYNKQMIQRESRRIEQHQRNNTKFKNKTSQQNALDYIEVNPNKYDANLKNPSTILKFNSLKNNSKEKVAHSTQKPILLMEYLIKTYTNEGDLVLDFTMGSGSTGVACINTNRKFIGIELDENYFNIAKDRIENSIKNK
jgi:site-specific DNA-methyltransferase (adenine-specific)